MADKEKKPAVEKKDTTFRLLKPGKQFVPIGAKYFREKDIKRGDKEANTKDNEPVKNITKKAFVPYQKILESKFTDDQFKKFFETEIFKDVPKEYLIGLKK